MGKHKEIGSSAADAKARGLKRYFTGKPCKRGHISQRWSASGLCISCSHELNAEWHARNRQSVRVRRSKYYSDNREKFLQESAEWRAANPEKRKEQSLLYRSSPEGKSRRSMLQMRRHSITLRALSAWNDELTDLVAIEACDLAHRRFLATGFKWQVDHAIPLQARNACGLHTADNLQVIPQSLNSWKRNRLVLTERGEWIKHT